MRRRGHRWPWVVRGRLTGDDAARALRLGARARRISRRAPPEPFCTPAIVDDAADDGTASSE
eukprot:1825528-Alexandrium_andersonii.AAC.1